MENNERREVFALVAMHAILSSTDFTRVVPGGAQMLMNDIACTAVFAADAMISRLGPQK